MAQKTTPDQSDPVAILQALRSKILALNPHELGFKPEEEHPTVWGVLMELTRPEEVVTLTALVDGTTSLYFSTGGGVLGSGNHASVGKAARQMTAVGELALEYTRPVRRYPLPTPGNIRFYLLTFHGVHTVEYQETDLQNGQHALSALYFTGQDLITQVRLVSEKKDPG